MKALALTPRATAVRKAGGPAVARLGFALLGLLEQKPASGYDLRRLFATTAMGSFSDSPGAIYPALARLEKQGMIRGRVEKSGLRQRQVFRVTASGQAALRRWLLEPIQRDDLVHRSDELMLRFAFMDNVAGRHASVEFLRTLAAALETYIAELREYQEQHQSEMPVSAMLALEAGIRGYEATLQWARHGLEVYARIAKGGMR
jgi:DNA-binding PadR family transcriptional regulator